MAVAHSLGDVMPFVVLGGGHGQRGHEVEGQRRRKAAHEQRVGQQRVCIGVAGDEQVEPKAAQLEERVVGCLQQTIYCWRNHKISHKAQGQTAAVKGDENAARDNKCCRHIDWLLQANNQG